MAKNEKPINLYSVKSAITFRLMDKHKEYSWNTLWKKMGEDKKFREEMLEWLDKKFIARVLVEKEDA